MTILNKAIKINIYYLTKGRLEFVLGGQECYHISLLEYDMDMKAIVSLASVRGKDMDFLKNLIIYNINRNYH